MAVSASFLEYVLEQFSASTREIISKRMFGGMGLYADDRFVAVLDDDRLFLKVDDESRPHYDREKARAFQPYGEGSYSMSYFELPTRVLEDRDEAAVWLERAYVAAGKKKAKAAVEKPKMVRGKSIRAKKPGKK
jgi:DNA transformation protein